MDVVISYIGDNLLEFLTLFLSVIGGTFALYQWQMTTKNNHAEYVDRLLGQMTDNELIHTFLFDVDYEVDWYNEDFHADEEHKNGNRADKAFFFLNYLCYLRNTGLLSKKDFLVFEYYITTVAQDDDTKAYFLDLYQCSQVYGKKFPFNYYLDYCISQGYISAQIKSRNYFKQVMLIESGQADSQEVTADVREINSTYGKVLYLQSCSRCKHCIYYNAASKTCQNEQSCEKHFWVSVDTPCSDFIFEKEHYGK